MTAYDAELRGLYRDVSKNTRTSYREAWRRWTEWCDTVGVNPVKASVPEAQAWIDHQRHRGVKVSSIRTRARAVNVILEYLAFLGHRPYEPFRLIQLPSYVKRGPKPTYPTHQILDADLLGRVLHETRGNDRAHCVVWACAGMGLSPSGFAAFKPERIKRVGDTSVAVIAHNGRGFLVPVPREIMLVIEERGWPFDIAVPASVRSMVKHELGPYVGTSAAEMRAWHQRTAVELGCDPERVGRDVATRLRWSSHPSVAVCALLRERLIAHIGS